MKRSLFESYLLQYIRVELVQRMYCRPNDGSNAEELVQPLEIFFKNSILQIQLNFLPSYVNIEELLAFQFDLQTRN